MQPLCSKLQRAIEYTITDKGELNVIKVEDESYNGSDDE